MVMTPSPEAPPSSRGRRRSHHACLTCRRKKTRCPGEKPACSSCVRLKQQCSYAAVVRGSRNGRSEERLAHLEEKLDMLLSGSLPNHGITTRSDQILEAIADTTEESSMSPPPAAPAATAEPSYPVSQRASTLRYGSEDSSNLLRRPDPADVAVGLDLYFKYCHRQPIWCFEREEVKDASALPAELACSVLALTSRFSHKPDQLQLRGESAKPWIMSRITHGAVQLETIESLCLLSYSSFLAGDVHLGQFHVGLALQLCRSAMLDVKSIYDDADDPTADRKKRLFWSLQLLEQFYGQQSGLLSISTDILRPSYSSAADRALDHHRPSRPTAEQLEPERPPLPRDDLGCSKPTEPGIWNTSVHLGWVWSRARKYVSECAQNILKEPWRHDSMYAVVLSDFMETENRIPMCHRYDSVKFYERKVDDLKHNRDYWAPWLKEQFIYHAIHTVLNHPFLYIVGAQRNPNLAIPNTFWRRSSELALLHSTWVVRMIDMAVDKQVPLVDPFFGHVAAIAATVHLYYCCATDARLKHKSNTDIAKCRRFLKSFVPFSPACGALDRTLERLTRIAAGSESMDVEDWLPSKIYLSVPLMWDILQFNCRVDAQQIPTLGLLDASLAPPSVAARDGDDDDDEQDGDGHNSPSAADDVTPILEIIVATSPEITINTADGGQVTLSCGAPLASSSAAAAAADQSLRYPRFSSRQPATPAVSTAPAVSNTTTSNTAPATTTANDLVSQQVEQTDSLTLNAAPWLWSDPSQFADLGDVIYHDSSISEGAGWWEVGNFGNTMFNHF